MTSPASTPAAEATARMVARSYPALKKTWVAASRMRASVRRRCSTREPGRGVVIASLIAKHEPDQACDIAADVLNGTQSLGSYLVLSQLINLRRQLEPYSGSMVVAGFLNCRQDAARLDVERPVSSTASRRNTRSAAWCQLLRSWRAMTMRWIWLVPS